MFPAWQAGVVYSVDADLACVMGRSLSSDLFKQKYMQMIEFNSMEMLIKKNDIEIYKFQSTTK